MRRPLSTFVLFLTALLALPGLLRAAPPPSTGFAPLDIWSAAVKSGDQAALRRFYLAGPDFFAQTPEGTTPDAAGEESAFWSSLFSHGLMAIDAKILEQTSPVPGQTHLVLRVELTFRGNPQPQRALVVLRQTWIKQGADWRIAQSARSDVGAMAAITLPQPKVPNTHLYPDPSEANRELASAINAAKIDHKRVLVVFGANWCYDCHVLDATLRSAEVAPLVAANYHVIHINIGDGDRNSDLADRFQVPLKKGIPSLAVLDDRGRLITSQKNGEFESAARIGMSDVVGFLNRWKS